MPMAEAAGCTGIDIDRGIGMEDSGSGIGIGGDPATGFDVGIVVNGVHLSVGRRRIIGIGVQLGGVESSIGHNAGPINSAGPWTNTSNNTSSSTTGMLAASSSSFHSICSMLPVVYNGGDNGDDRRLLPSFRTVCVGSEWNVVS